VIEKKSAIKLGLWVVRLAPKLAEVDSEADAKHHGSAPGPKGRSQ